MKIYILLGSLLSILALLAAQCGAATSSEPQLEIKDASVRLTPTNGVIYLTLVNDGGANDALIGVKTNIAKIAELHETTMDDNDVMRMSPVENIEIPAGGSASLEPGGKHVMLMDIQGEWQPGDDIEVTFSFQQSEPITLNVQVDEGMTSDSDHADMQGENSEDEMNMEHNMEDMEHDMDHDEDSEDHN